MVTARVAELPRHFCVVLFLIPLQEGFLLGAFVAPAGHVPKRSAAWIYAVLFLLSAESSFKNGRVELSENKTARTQSHDLSEDMFVGQDAG